MPEVLSAARRSAEWFVFGVLPVAVFCSWLDVLGPGIARRIGRLLGVRHKQYWQAGNDVVNGVSPYPSEAALSTAGDHLDAQGLIDVFRFSYLRP